MRRREFISFLAGTAASGALSLSTSAQQAERPRRVGVLFPATANNSEYQTLLNAFLERLQQLGWNEGRNLQVDIRWAGGAADDNRKHAGELVALAPDVIFASGASSAGPLLQTTRTLPVVFAIVPDPVGAGFVESLARPGGNATGFTSFEFGIGGKWLELLKEISPRVRRAGIIRDSTTSAGIGQWSAIQTAAPAFGMEVSPINLRDARELDSNVAAFARAANGGLVVTSSGLAIALREAIVAQSTKHRLPAVYYSRAFLPGGGLMSYGPDRIQQFQARGGLYRPRPQRREAGGPAGAGTNQI